MVWRKHQRAKPYWQVDSSNSIMQSLTDCPELKAKDWSCVTLHLGMIYPFSSIPACLVSPRGEMMALGIWSRCSIGRGSCQALLTSLDKIPMSQGALQMADLWFPYAMASWRSSRYADSLSGARGNVAPWCKVQWNWGQSRCLGIFSQGGTLGRTLILGIGERDGHKEVFTAGPSCCPGVFSGCAGW